MSGQDECNNIGKSFLQQYFGSHSEEHYANFYGNDSMLSVENDKFVGTKNIAEKLASIKSQYKVTFHEIQPSQNGILIFLSGQMVLDGETNPINFHRIFFLAASQTGSLYVKNDMFLITFG